MSSEYSLGFQSLEEEVSGRELPVEGELPSWLSGRLLRNGPARFETPNQRLEHWFDGLAMVRSFAFDDGAVTYTNRFLRTEAYRHAMAEGRLASSQFATGTPGSAFRRLLTQFVPESTDNANVNVASVGGEFVALTETPHLVAFDPETLATRGPVEFDDDLSGQLTTAHPHHDDDRGETVNYVTEFSLRNRYHVYRIPDGTTTRRPIASVEADRPAYMHSFALTDDYVVLTEFPFVVNPMRFFVPGDDSFVDKYEWKPEQGTRFVVVNRHTGRIVAEPRAKPFFAFHHVDAFQRDGDLLLDVVAYPDPSVIDSMYLEAVRSGSVEFPVGELRRYRVSLDGDGSRVEHRPLYEGGVELPTVAPSVRRAPYRYVYGQGGERGDGDRALPNQLVKVDVHDGFARVWLEGGAYVGEPVFVPRPNPVREDDGVVLSVVLDANSERSFLLVLDAETFDELARAWLPHALPFDFHGQFFETDA